MHIKGIDEVHDFFICIDKINGENEKKCVDNIGDT